MKIGVCVPCHVDHLFLLPNCIESTRQQTRAADEVVVSVSSATTCPDLPCTMLVRPEVTCAGENRNIAARLIADKVDVITFIDADDVMHPRRLEMIEKYFTDHPEMDYLLHSFMSNGEWSEITGTVRMHPFAGVYRVPGDLCGRTFGDGIPQFHNGHISCRSTAWKQNPMLERYGEGEDSEYVARMWEKGYTFGGTSDVLTWYRRGNSIPFKV